MTFPPYLSASSEMDVRHLQALVLRVPEEYRGVLAANLMCNDLMQTTLLVRTLVKMGAVLRGWDIGVTWALFLDRAPALAEDIVRDFAEHVVRGHDREDEDSVGGLSQREMGNALAILAHVARLEAKDRAILAASQPPVASLPMAAA